MCGMCLWEEGVLGEERRGDRVWFSILRKSDQVLQGAVLAHHRVLAGIVGIDVASDEATLADEIESVQQLAELVAGGRICWRSWGLGSGFDTKPGSKDEKGVGMGQRRKGDELKTKRGGGGCTHLRNHLQGTTRRASHPTRE